MASVFDPDRLHEIARGVVGLPAREAVDEVVRRVAEAYPGHVDPKPHWIFNVAAGATGVMAVLHGSLSEYLIVFGSPVGTEAYSGRYLLDIHDFVLCGQMWTYTQDEVIARVVTGPGERALLPRGQAKGFRILEDTWMLEYGRGIIPASLPTALSDILMGAFDVETVWDTLVTYGRLTVKELLRGKL